MTKMRVAVCTLGCKVNQYESASLTLLFQERGYQLVDFEGEEDVYIVNTCTVTHLADRKSRKMIRRAAKANPEAIVAVTGCYAQVSQEEILKIPGVNLVAGTRDRAQLADLVEKAIKERSPVSAVSEYLAGD